MATHRFQPTTYSNVLGTLPPALTIASGDTVITETLDAWGYDKEGVQRATGPNPMNENRPLTILIAALGGEGGGVLNDWIVACALDQGLPVQATSVPSVAQRTGSTSYYVEMMRTPAPDGAQPVFALSPMPGGVDVVVASELLEAARTIERGFVHPKRTTLISSSSRVYTTQEKMQMGDGRFDESLAHAAARRLSAKYL